MCGLCTEQIALRLLEEEKEGGPQEEPDSLTAEFLLQETEELVPSLDGLGSAETRETGSLVSPETLLCRGMELLLHEGYASREYQELLHRKAYRTAVMTQCKEEVAIQVRGFSERFPLGPFLFLYERETYLQGKGLDSEAVSQGDKDRLLNAYIRWWLLGEGQRKNDLHARMAETGILDPIEEVTREERAAFETIFRALWYSLQGLISNPGKETLLEIITRYPHGVPFFDAKDLWLQRRAALCLFDQDGLWPLLERMKEVRPTIFYYLDLKRGLDRDQKEALAVKFQSFPRGTIRDDHFDMEEWMSSDDFLPG